MIDSVAVATFEMPRVLHAIRSAESKVQRTPVAETVASPPHGVIEMIRGAMTELSLGDPAELSTDVGPVIDEDARAQINVRIREKADLDKLQATFEEAAKTTIVPDTKVTVSRQVSALEERHKFLGEQLEDLRKSRADLLTVIRDVDQVADPPVLDPVAFRQQQPRRRARTGGPRGNQRLGQLEVEIGKLHSESFRFGGAWRNSSRNMPGVSSDSFCTLFSL